MLKSYRYEVYILDYQTKLKDKIVSCLYVGILIGYTAKKQWLVWDRRSVKVRYNIIFNKNNLLFYKKNIVVTPIKES